MLTRICELSFQPMSFFKDTEIRFLLILENRSFTYRVQRSRGSLCRYRSVLSDGVLRHSAFPGRDKSGATLRRNTSSWLQQRRVEFLASPGGGTCLIV